MNFDKTTEKDFEKLELKDIRFLFFELLKLHKLDRQKIRELEERITSLEAKLEKAGNKNK